MAVGKVVLSTRIGMEGIAAQHRRECLLADTPQEILAALRWCDAQGKGLAELGHRGLAFCVKNYDNLEVARRLVEEMEVRSLQGVDFP